MNLLKRVLPGLLSMQVCFTCSCARRNVTEKEARQAAFAEIEEAQSAFAYDAKRLAPPSMRRVPDGYDLEVRDEAQNVWVFVHVSPTGLPEISAEPLDKHRRRHEEGVQWAAARRATKVCTFGTQMHALSPDGTERPITRRSLDGAPTVQSP
jgi:hypothetical protein